MKKPDSHASSRDGRVAPRPPIGVWIVDLKRHVEALLSWEARHHSLAPAEQRRAANMAKQAATEFVAARVVLRRCLTLVVGDGVANRPFKRDTRGKPFVLTGEAGFSLSHSGGLVAIAISTAGEIGIDMEQIRSMTVPGADLRRLESRLPGALRTVFSPGASALADRTTTEIQRWTVIEAWCKANGLRLADFLAKDRAVPADFALFGAGGWTARALRLPAGYVGTFCAAGENLAHAHHDFDLNSLT